MCRVANEVRIFPLLALGGDESPFVALCVQAMSKEGLDVSIETVPYEFQRGANQMMRITRPIVHYPPVPLTPFTMTETRVGLTAGLDVVGHLSERVGLAPFFRLHWVQRPDSPQDTTDGLPETV